MRRHIFMVLTVALLITAFKHPMHVSVTEIEYSEKSKSLKVTTHLFLDDIEKQYREASGDREADVLNPNIKPEFDKFLKKYMLRSLSFQVNGKPSKPIYLGYEVEGEGLWSYIEIEGVNKLKTLEVRNTILLETYDDQTNLVHFEHNDNVQSAKLDKSKTRYPFNIED